MKILVAGMNGQVSQSLIAANRPPDVELLALGRPELDLAAPHTIDAAIATHRPDIVVNAAAYTAVDKAETERVTAFAVNASGAGWLAEACHRAGQPIIHISTDYVFDGTKPSPYDEDDATAPIGIYGQSKLAGEQAVASGCPRHIILRTSWVYSRFGNNFVKTMLRLASTRGELNVVDDQIGCPTYAPHLADAILAVARRIADNSATTPWGTYNAAGTGEVTWCGFAREVFEQSAEHGGPFATVHAISTAQFPTPAQRPANSRLDCAKLEAAFALRLPDWQVGAAACVRQLTVG